MRTLLLAFAVWLALGTVVNLLVRFDAYGPLARASRGLVSPTLQGGLAVVAGLLLFLRLFGGIGPRAVGWRPGDLKGAALGVIGLFLLGQATHLLLAAGTGEPISLAASWRERKVLLVGGLAGQWLGNALAEETMFRGFLLVQLSLWFAARGSRRPVAGAWLVSTGLFSIQHLPNRLLVKDLTGAALAIDLCSTFFLGSLLAALFLLARNLLLTVGVHGLWNRPSPLLEGVAREHAAFVLVLWTLVGTVELLAWRRRRGAAGRG